MTSARSTTLRMAAGVAVAALALAGCGDSDDGATATPTTSTTVTTPDETPTAPETDATDPVTSPVSPEPSTSESAPPSTRPVIAQAKVVAGQVTTKSDNYAVAPGEDVRIAVKSDTANELHVHGVEQELALEANKKGVLEFTIPDDLAPGVYEVELHDPALLLFTLTVS